jgi:sugar lactone lactonase YvrE
VQSRKSLSNFLFEFLSLDFEFLENGIPALTFALLLMIASHAFAGNLVLNANGGTLAMGSGVGSAFTLTDASTTNPAGALSFSCTITSIGGTYTVDYACTGGNFTFTSNDGSTTVTGGFAKANVYETASGGGRGGHIKYAYQFVGPFTGVETLNGVAAAVNGEITLVVGGLASPLGSTTAGASTTGVNWAYTPVYISDYSFSRILRSDDMFGTNQLTFGSTGTGTNQFYGPHGIALDASGRIYVTDGYNARIVRMDDMNGTNWTTFGTYGTGTNQFSYATADIAIDSQGRIYVADPGDGRIVRFDDMNGTNWVALGTPGSGTNQFYGPSGIALDASGNIYVADPGNSRIVEMSDMTGANWTSLHQSPDINGYIFSFASPSHLSIDPLGRIVVGDSNDAIRVDDMTGTNWTTLILGYTVNGIQVDPGGTTFVATQYGGEMLFDDILTGAGFLSNTLVSQPGGIAVVPVPNPAPAIKLSGTSLTFGQQNVGTTSAPQSITLTNFGSAPLNLTISVTKDFVVSTTCSTSLPGGSNCTISVSYAPTITGPETGTVTLSDNAFTGTQTISLSGTGTAPVVSISPGTVNFQPQLLNTTSGAQFVVLSNSGTGPLTFSGSGISTAGDFAQISNCGAALASGTNCQINVTYTPTVVGAETGALFVMSNAATQTVTLTGMGSSGTPSYSVSPESLVFSPQLIKTKSAYQSVVLTNTGTTSFTVSGTAITGDFSKTGTCGVLRSNKSCTLKIYFTPTAGGTRTGTLTYTLPTGTVAVALTGTGDATAAGWLSISPSSLDFNNGYIVGDNPSMKLTVTNTDGIFAGISKISKSGSAVFTETNNCGSGLAAYASCTVTVTFTPTKVGTFTGTLTVTESAGTAHQIPLSGTAGSGGGM